MVSAVDQATRALVAVLRALCVAFSCNVSVGRDSTDEGVRRAFREVARRVHPDKEGGSTTDFQRLSAAHDLWLERLKQRRKVGRPARSSHGQGAAAATAGPLPPVVLPERGGGKRDYEVQAQAVMLTYQGCQRH